MGLEGSLDRSAGIFHVGWCADFPLAQNQVLGFRYVTDGCMQQSHGAQYGSDNPLLAQNQFQVSGMWSQTAACNTEEAMSELNTELA